MKDLTTKTDLTQQDLIVNSDKENWWSQEKVKSRIKKQLAVNKTQKLLIIVCLVIIVLAVLSQSLGNNKQEQVDLIDQQLEQKTQEQLSPLQEQLMSLQEQLINADPSIKHSPFPNVDMNLSIDTTARR